MAVTRRGRFYHYEFQLNSKTYAGTTKKTTEREARAVERQKRQEAADGIQRAELERDTVGTVFKRYWEAHGCKLSWAPTLKAHMVGLGEFFGADKPFSDITKADVAKALEDYAATDGRKNRGGKTVRAGKPSDSTVNRRMAVFRAIYLKARDEWDLPVQNIAFRVHKRTEPNARVRHCTVSQARTLLEHLPERGQLIAGFALATGCRENEIRTLAPSRVNFETMQAEVKTKSRKKNATRFVDLNAAALNVLGRCDMTGALVFDFTNHRKDWESAVKAAGLTDFRFHDLRHTFATWMGQAGASIQIVQQLLGHTDVRTTSKYLHVLKDDARRAAAKAPTLIAGKVEPLKPIDETGAL